RWGWPRSRGCWDGRWRASERIRPSRAASRSPSASYQRCSASTTASLHRYCPTDRNLLGRIAHLVVARLEVDQARDRDGRTGLRRLVDRRVLRETKRLLKDRDLFVGERHDVGFGIRDLAELDLRLRIGLHGDRNVVLRSRRVHVNVGLWRDVY